MERNKLELDHQEEKILQRAKSIVARRVREEREALGFTHDRLSELSGIARSTLWKLENDKTSPTLTILVKVAHAMGLGEEGMWRLFISSDDFNSQMNCSTSIRIKKAPPSVLRLVNELLITWPNIVKEANDAGED